MIETLYHVSPVVNSASIAENGVDPAFARTKRKVSWWCTFERLDWALIHTANRHRCPPNALMVAEATFETNSLVKTHLTGVYCCDSVITDIETHNSGVYTGRE